MSRWLPVIGIIGLACLGVGVYSVTQSKPPATDNPTIINAGKVFPQINLPPEAYTAASTFPQGKPVLRQTKSGREYLSVRPGTSLVYSFTLTNPPADPATIWVKGTFSAIPPSGLLQHVPDPYSYTTAVRLLVNGQPADLDPLREAEAWIEAGGDIPWVVSARLFRKGRNTITLEIPQGKNWLAIIGDLIIQLPERPS
jgi:hypothetical protein